jgi:hypothetical protein
MFALCKGFTMANKEREIMLPNATPGLPNLIFSTKNINIAIFI